jgi:hypothetical protein
VQAHRVDISTPRLCPPKVRVLRQPGSRLSMNIESLTRSEDSYPDVEEILPFGILVDTIDGNIPDMYTTPIIGTRFL